jgi:hypothetical protein
MKYEFQDLLNIFCEKCDVDNDNQSTIDFRENYYFKRNFDKFTDFQDLSIYSEDISTIKEIDHIVSNMFSNNIKEFNYSEVASLINKLAGRHILSGQTSEYTKEGNSYIKSYQMNLKCNMTFAQVAKSIEEGYYNNAFKGSKSFRISLRSSNNYNNIVTGNSMPAFIFHLDYDMNEQLTKKGFINLSFVSNGEEMIDLFNYEEKLYNLLLIARNQSEFNELGLRINFEIVQI